MKLEEGNRYNFRVARKVRFEGENFFLLSGPDSRNYLLPAERYSGYGILPGNIVSCMVDKINCKGEVYLEPEHPIYREDHVYEFKVVGHDSRIDKSGRIHKVVLVTDILGKEIAVPEDIMSLKDAKVNSPVSLRVSRISKGQVILTGFINGDHSGREEDPTLTDFVVRNIARGMDGREHFVVTGSDGQDYTMPFEYYKHYRLEKGSSFKGRFIRYNKGSEVRIEPVNPFYSPGKIYSFTVIDTVAIADNLDPTLILSDSHGFTHRAEALPGKQPGDKVMMKVEKIRKGWPLLIPV